ncbi:MAG: C-GCAxxG-C-C family protein [Lachnospira sp.]
MENTYYDEACLSRADRAEQLFRKGFNCSQSVFAAFSDVYGMDEKTALKISASFGGGMGRMREVCGCMSAIALAAGLETGCTTEHDPKGKEYNYKVVQHLADEFKKISGGSIICRELLGLDTIRKDGSSPVPGERTNEYYKKRPCISLIRDACSIIEKELIGGNKNE